MKQQQAQTSLTSKRASLRRLVGRLLVVNLIILAYSLFLVMQTSDSGVVQTAVAKGQQLYDLNTLSPFNITAVQSSVVMQATTLWGDKEVDFVNALPLTYGESRQWQDVGCQVGKCAHITFYNYTDGGTIEAIFHRDTAKIVSHWQNREARPGGSQHIMPQAIAIAAADANVQAVLGDIGGAEPAMIPMSAWLLDDDCSEAWCVDLTFHDPAGSGRIFHVFVNMEAKEVARTFYTRARPERSAAKPVAQREAYSDGCREQYEWRVCWEMTAHDGMLFRDAEFRGQLIFSSAKIPQIEAWYPSWPGGYRDEIGFSATVPPFGDTTITDLEDGFEVRQLFTEFTRWPNCICCYRYEEIIRFNDDGSFELRFVSHGPGCDDLSIYRPFWRIDVDLNGPDNDRVWLWQEGVWQEMVTEFETAAFVEDISPEGTKLGISGGNLHYRWTMAPTDPLGLDEAHLFALKDNEQEGDGPISTGPGDTYRPPRQWLNEETLSGENVVVWYVPSLKTKKGSPWWCMPDPEPAFTPCEAILHVDRYEQEPHELTAEELAQITPTVVVSPTPLPPSAPTPTPRPIQGEDAEEIILNSGCGACHAIGELGEAGKVGPDLTNIATVARQRIPNMSAEDYLRQSILNPNAYIVPSCPNAPCLPNIMPQDYALRLSNRQVEVMITYLLQLDGTDVADSIAEPPSRIGANSRDVATVAPKPFPAPKRVSTVPQQAVSSANIVVQLALISLVFLLSLFRFLKGPEG